MEIDLSIATFLKLIKEKENLNNITLAEYMDSSPALISLYLSNSIRIMPNKIEALSNCLKENKQKEFLDYIFESFPVGFYHGSRNGIKGEIDCYINKDKMHDFGYGFYLGTTFKQSSTFISGEDNDEARIYKYSFSLDGLDYLKLDGVIWALFVAYQRKKIPNIKENQHLIKQIQKIINHHYDVIIGPIADDKISMTMDNFFANNITLDQLLNALTQLDIGVQYCLKTEKASQNLKLENIYNVKERTLRYLIKEYAYISIQSASTNAYLINKQNLKGKKFSDLVKEYAKKPLF